MSKKIYEVRGTITIEVLKRVKADDEYEAMELAEKYFFEPSSESTSGCVPNKNG